MSAERSLRASIAAHSLHAQVDGRTITAKARAAAAKRFEREVDPNNELPVDERRRRAQHAQAAHMRRMALASAKARKNGANKAARLLTPQVSAQSVSSPAAAGAAARTGGTDRGATKASSGKSASSGAPKSKKQPTPARSRRGRSERPVVPGQKAG